MQRWNDKIRPVELRELDKQAHKMIIAYFLGKFEENRPDFDWIEVIEGGLFEFLQRIVITDLKPQIFSRIKEDRDKYRELNRWVFNKLDPIMDPLGSEVNERFRAYFSGSDDTLNKRILSAAHFQATRWEFDIIERANPAGHEIPEIKKVLQQKQEKYYDLSGIQQLALYGKFGRFVDLCGQLRFQVRWGHINMIPRTSVLGHMLFVAVLAYLFSLENGSCRRRRINNYFTGLFHDLPEVLTRDIISPVKRSVEGLDMLIKEYEKEEMEREVYNLIPEDWHSEMRMFTEDEFSDVVVLEGRRVTVGAGEISRQYNDDRFNPRDGLLLKGADELAAFAEAHTALENGVKSKDLLEAHQSLRERYRDRVISGVDVGSLFAAF